jgi:ABC-type Fe3+-hydroxamate transport system substrate-binding protein
VSSDNPEGILALAPDLVILDTYSMTFDGALVRTLEDAGLTVLCMALPTDLNTMMNTLTALGEVTGAEQQAAQMVADVQAILNTVAMALARVQPDSFFTAMYYEDLYDPNGAVGVLCAYGPGTPQDAIFRAAGLINVCDAPENFSPVSKEKIVAEWKPDVLFVPSFTYDENWKANDDGGAAYITGVLADPALAGLPAVQNQMIFAVPILSTGTTSQYMAQAVYEVAKLFYPVE